LITSIVRTALNALRRDRGALALAFILPVAFFTIFAVIFGSRRDTLPRINVLVVDEDHSSASQKLLKDLESQKALYVYTRPADKDGVALSDFTPATAEVEVKEGRVSVALVIPNGFGKNPNPPGSSLERPSVQLLKDSSDMVAPQVIVGMLQKVAMEEAGRQSSEAHGSAMKAAETTHSADGMLISVTSRDILGEKQVNPMVSYYAAAVAVMFLLFTASGASGSLLDEVESGTLDRVLSTRITMGMLLAGKLCYSTMLAFAQLVAMFLWAWLVFKVDFIHHIPGFVIMGLSTAFAVGAFGILLASVCRTRAQLGPLSTLVVLLMSSIGGSMFPRFLLPEAMKKAGMLTLNGWAIDGFLKVFWRDEPLWHLWPEVSVLIGAGLVLFAIARRLARRWEYA